jgi:hypothetical protein
MELNPLYSPNQGHHVWHPSHQALDRQLWKQVKQALQNGDQVMLYLRSPRPQPNGYFDVSLLFDCSKELDTHSLLFHPRVSHPLSPTVAMLRNTGLAKNPEVWGPVFTLRLDPSRASEPSLGLLVDLIECAHRLGYGPELAVK